MISTGGSIDMVAADPRKEGSSSVAHKVIEGSTCHQWEIRGKRNGVVRGTWKPSATVGVFSGVRYTTVWQDG